MNSNKKTARDASYFQTSGALLLALKDWASVVEQLSIWPGCSDFKLCIVSIGTRSSMVIRLGSCWRRIDISNGLVTYVRPFRDLFSYSNNIE